MYTFHSKILIAIFQPFVGDQLYLIKVDLKEGIKVLITGKVTTYSQQSKYQLIVQKVELEGQGSILQILEEEKKLLMQGFFDDRFKKIPIT